MDVTRNTRAITLADTNNVNVATPMWLRLHVIPAVCNLRCPFLGKVNCDQLHSDSSRCATQRTTTVHLRLINDPCVLSQDWEIVEHTGRSLDGVH